MEGEAQPAASEHLAACAQCRRLVDDLVALEQAARTLPVYDPSPRLWARLESAALEEGLWRRDGWRQWLGLGWSFEAAQPALAGALALMVLFAGGLTAYYDFSPVAELALVTNPVEVAQAELVQEPSYTERYQIHLKQVEHSVLEQTQPADEDLVALAADPLDDLERAIGETQARVNNYPDDTLAREELQRLYRQKGAVLQAVNYPTW